MNILIQGTTGALSIGKRFVSPVARLVNDFSSSFRSYSVTEKHYRQGCFHYFLSNFESAFLHSCVILLHGLKIINKTFPSTLFSKMVLVTTSQKIEFKLSKRLEYGT